MIRIILGYKITFIRCNIFLPKFIHSGFALAQEGTYLAHSDREFTIYFRITGTDKILSLA